MKTPNQSLFIIVGAIVFCALAISLIHLANFPYFDHARKSGTFLEKLQTSPPNEIGDTLAGVFGTLAFVAASIAIVMQSFELRAQRVELELTREQFEKMAISQSDQVKILEAQGRIFENEQRQRDEGRAQDLLEEKLRSLVFEISESGGRGLVWKFSNDVIDDDFGSNGQIFSYTIGEQEDEHLGLDEAIISIRRRLPARYQSMWDLLHQSVDTRLPVRSTRIPELISKIQNILAMKDSLSPPQQERLERMRLFELAQGLKEIEDTKAFWWEDPK